MGLVGDHQHVLVLQASQDNFALDFLDGEDLPDVRQAFSGQDHLVVGVVDSQDHIPCQPGHYVIGLIWVILLIALR